MANDLGDGGVSDGTIRDEHLPRQIMNWRNRRFGHIAYRKRLTIHESPVKRLPFRPEAVAHLEMFSSDRLLRRQSFVESV